MRLRFHLMRTSNFVAKTLALALLAAPLAACGQNNDNQNQTAAPPAEQAAGSGPSSEQTAPAPAPAPAPAQPAPAQSAPPPAAEAPPPPPERARSPAHAGRRIHETAAQFRTLARQAGTATPRRLNTLIDRANSQARDVRPLLSAVEWTQLHRQIKALREAKRDHRRGEIRRAANAAYRVLTGENATTPRQHAANGDIPGGLQRIDDAAAQYRKELNAIRHPRWARMRNHADKAHEIWSHLRQRVDNRGPRHAMSQAITAMQTAADQKNEQAAKRAVRDEREASDGLKRYFRRH